MSETLEFVLHGFVGLLISLVVSFYAYKKNSLAMSGMIAAIFLGTTVVALGGYFFMVVVLLFFASSSLLSKLHKKEKERDAHRTYKQVLANGGVGLIIVILYFFTKDSTYYILFGVSFAISTSDTWSSEIGRLAKNKPRHILTWKEMDTGLSGAVSLLGIVASIVGSALISVVYLGNLYIVIGGFLGSIIDSLLGTIQIKYITTTGVVLDEVTEDTTIERTTGCGFLTNNMVNFLSNLIGTFILYLFLVII